VKAAIICCLRRPAETEAKRHDFIPKQSTGMRLKTDLIYTWIIAARNVAFTEFLHHFLLKHNDENYKTDNEMQLEKIIQTPR
jgi:hypothetical protein